MEPGAGRLWVPILWIENPYEVSNRSRCDFMDFYQYQPLIHPAFPFVKA